MNMSEGLVLEIFQEALMTALKLAMPLLLVSLLVGLVIAVLQAATQIHEQTLTFVPKLVGLALVLLLLGSWMFAQMRDFMLLIFETIGTYV